MGFEAGGEAITEPVDALHCLVDDSMALPPRAPGALDGVRVVIKDLVAVRGRTSSFGLSRWRETHAPADRDAWLVDALLGAGATVVGMAKMDQLAYSLIGNVGEGRPPVNSHDPESFCGGSSSGSASAVAGQLADVGIATDTAGSTRVPASACGLIGLRTTHGAIDTDGVIPLAPSLDVVGLLARDPRPLAQTLGVLAPQLTRSATVRTVLVPDDLPESAVLRGVGQRLEALIGSRCRPVSVAGWVNAEVGALFARLQGREIWSEHGAWIDANRDALAPDVRSRLDQCRLRAADDPATREADLLARTAYTDAVESAVGPDAILLLPVVPGPGPRLAWSAEELLAFRTAAFRLTAVSSLSGLPEAVMPVDTKNNTMPIGILGRRGSDHVLVQLIGECRSAER